MRVSSDVSISKLQLLNKVRLTLLYLSLHAYDVIRIPPLDLEVAYSKQALLSRRLMCVLDIGSAGNNLNVNTRGSANYTLLCHP